MQKVVRLALLCLLVVPFAGRAANPEVEPWLMLEKAGQAAHKLSYKGIFVYQSGRSVSNLQLTHMNYAQGEYARVISLDGMPREVLRQGNEAVIYSPQNEKVVIEKRRVRNAFPALLPSLTDTLKASYQARIVGRERVGGRDGVVVQLVPLDLYRYGYRFSIDRESGLLLKSVTLDEHNEAIEQVAFSQLTMMDPVGMDWFHPNVERGKDYVMQPEQAVTPESAEGCGWTISQLPPGFVKVDQVRRSLPGKSVPVSQLIFSDGIASVSMFIEPLEKALPKRGHILQGVTNVYANVVDGYQVIVVGEVPAAAVRQIGEAVSLRK